MKNIKIVEAVGLTVDFVRPHTDILLEAGLEPNFWQHVPTGQDPRKTGKFQLNLVLVTISERVEIGNVFAWIKERDVVNQYAGSGAWVRSAYLKRRPFYDGGGPILFPDEGLSRWRYTLEPKEQIHIPGAWHDFGKVGAYSMDAISDYWRDGRRIALVETLPNDM